MTTFLRPQLRLLSRAPALAGFGLAFLAVGVFAPRSQAATPIVVHSFAPADTSHVNVDGVHPSNGVIQGGDGDWYGTALAGGPSGAGTLFKMHPDGSGFTVLKTFDGSNQNADGGYPGGSMTRGIDSALYGTTSNGGANGDRISSPGTIFRVSPTGQFQTLHSFPANDADGADGGGQVFQGSDGMLYGDFDTSPGFLFRMNADGTGYQTIHMFAPKNNDTLGTNVGGAYPEAVTVEGTDGDLYGIAASGGAHGGGTVFKIARDGSGFTVLHDFDGTNPLDGATPSGDLRKGLDDAFYGITSQGGANKSGTVYRIDQGGNFRQLASFPVLPTNGLNSVGANPTGETGLAQGSDGTLYGTTTAGGANGYGTLFAVRPDGSNLTSLFDFRQSDTDTINAGSRFEVSLGSNGLLYVTTVGGGVNGTGAILNLPSLSPHTHLLWNNSDSRVMLWSVAADGSFTVNGFGPYTDGAAQNKWSATAVATGPDGKGHLLWNNTDGRVMLWTVDDSGNFTLAGYGPYTDGAPNNKWSAVGVSVGPDNVVHLLWSNTDHRVMLWSVAQDYSFTLAGYGPYTDGAPQNLWTATALATGPDNVSRIVWNNTDNRVMLWKVDTAFNFTLAGYGPYTDGAPQNLWSAVGVSVGPDNLTHLLWSNTDRRAMFWNVDSAFGFTLAGYGPYTDDAPANLWSATALATGPDGLSHILWGNTDNRAMLWGVNNAFGFTVAGYGPYTDNAPGNLWSVTAVSAGP